MIAWVLAPAVMWLPRGLFEPRTIPFEFLRIAFHPVAFEFGAGMLLAILWFKRTDKLVIRLPFEPLVALVLAFCFPLAVTIWSEWVLGYRPSAFTMALCCAPVLFVAAATKHATSKISRIRCIALSSRWRLSHKKSQEATKRNLVRIDR